MKRDFQWKDTSFHNAIAEYKVATGKDMADVLNRGIRNAGFETAKATPKEDAGDIEKELRRDKIALKIATKQLRGRIGKTYIKRGKLRTVTRVTRKQISLKARRLITKRKKRRGFLRAGWIAAMVAAGVKGVKRGDNLLKNGKSKLGSGRLATPQRLNAYLGNAAWGRLKGKNRSATAAKMQTAQLTGIRLAKEDMLRHAAKVTRETAQRYSASKRTR